MHVTMLRWWTLCVNSVATPLRTPCISFHSVLPWLLLVLICCGQPPARSRLCFYRRAASVPKSAYLRRFTCPLNNAHQARVTLLYALYSESVAICSIKLKTMMCRWYMVALQSRSISQTYILDSRPRRIALLPAHLHHR